MSSLFPDLPGVYIFKDGRGKVIYVGKARSLRDRVSSYFGKPSGSPKTEALLGQFSRIDYIVTPSELEALLLENRLIKKFKPRYNLALKDDKNYPYIVVTMQEEWPRIFTSRKELKDGALYFGPFESRSVKDTLRLMARLFPLRKCKESPLKTREQPCLNFHIKRCWGPCVGGISKERYRMQALAAADLLSGDLDKALGHLKEEMEEAASSRKFEQAAKVRDRIRNLERMRRGKPSWMPKKGVIEGDTSLWELRDSLKLKRVPSRIEAFDVSNIQGKDTVASMVVFENGEPKRSDYRKFIIRSVSGIDDPASIGEAVFRRYAKTLKKELPNPDLVMVDGGITQARAAREALGRAGLGRPVVGLAKKEEHIYFPGGGQPLRLPRGSKGLSLLMRIRDEAHRFAVSFHRKRRGRGLIEGSGKGL